MRQMGIGRPQAIGRSLLADVNAANVAAGLTTGLSYLVGGLTLHREVAARMGLTPEATASWFIIVCATSGVASLLLSLRYRQPLALAATVPGWLLLAGVGDRYSAAEIAGAALAAGLLIVVLGLAGLGERLMRWLPLPIVMGMLAGSILDYAIAIFAHLEAQPAPVGAAIAGYFVARALGRNWLPPVAVAAVAGFAVVLTTQPGEVETLRWLPPVLAPQWPALNPGSLITLTLPLVVMVAGIGNVQGIGILLGQGYRPPIKRLTVVIGLASMVNALFGGHPATISRSGIPIVASPEAGPRDQRYVASVVSGLCLLLLALGTTTAGALLGALPAPLVATLAGLTLLSTLLDALRKALVSDLPLGAFFALIIAASPLTVLGIGAAFWALVGGLLVSFVLERPACRRAWRGQRQEATPASGGQMTVSEPARPLAA